MRASGVRTGDAGADGHRTEGVRRASQVDFDRRPVYRCPRADRRAVRRIWRKSHVKRIAILSVAAIAAVVSAPASAVEYKHKVVQAGVTFEWAIDGDSLHGQLSAKTTGWVGVGFNATKDMQDAGFVIGAVKDGQPKAAIFLGVSPASHSKAIEQAELTGIDGDEKDGITTIRFTIPLVSKVAGIRPIVPDRDTKVLLAYSNDDSIKVKHVARAEFLLNLATGELKR